jgi:DUF1009 family protein
MPAPLGLVAGQGDLPVELAARAERDARPLFVVRLSGMASPLLDVHPGLALPVERPGDILSALKGAGCREVVFAGKVHRPPLLAMKPDRFAVKALLMRLTGVWGRDDSLNRVVASIFRDAGLTVVGPTDLWPTLLVPQGVLGARAPTPDEERDIAVAAAAALRVGAADRGQGAVARGGEVIAVEDRQHTRGLLKRVAGMPGRGGVLVKRVKPQQDRRLDLPVVGPDTISDAIAARLTGIAVEAGGAILVRRDETTRRADAAGIFLIGLPPLAAA